MWFSAAVQDALAPRPRSQRRAVVQLVLVGVLLAGSGWLAPVAAQEPCDPLLKPRPTDAIGYRLRGNRCEGIYVAEVGSTSLHVASFTAGSPGFEAALVEELVVQWARPRPTPVWLQAMGLRPRLYYRMDVALPPDVSNYRWPTDVLREVKLTATELGVIAWARLDVGGRVRTVHFPVSIGDSDDKKRSTSYRIAIWPGRELVEIYVTLAAVGKDGRPGALVRDGQVLGYQFYPADRAIAVNIPVAELKAPGVYYLLLAADVRGGATASTELWFYHSAQ